MSVSELVRPWREEEEKGEEKNGKGAERDSEKIEAGSRETKGNRCQSWEATEQEPASSGNGDSKIATSIAKEFMGVYDIFAYIG